MRICVDWGNTLVKIAVFNSNVFLEHKDAVTAMDAPNVIQNFIEKFQIQEGILCSVAKPNSEVEAMFQNSGFIILDNDTKIPLMNAYQSSETLGKDRIATAVAAYHSHPKINHLAISVGTAIVYNHVSERGIFRGGAISPGIDMRLKALNQFTHALPLIERNGHFTLVGYDTESSIRSGAINGALLEIEGFIQSFKNQWPDIKVTITGGDASLLEKRIGDIVTIDQNLILKGLNIIYAHNAE